MSLSSGSNPRTDTHLNPCKIRHDSLFKAVWDWLILALVIFTAVEIPYFAAFLVPLQGSKWSHFDELTPLLAVNLLVDVIFIADILINFRTTFINPSTDEVVSAPRQIALRYLKTWFVVDFLSAIPIELMVLSPVKKVDSTTPIFGLLKTLRLLRLVRVGRKLDRYSEYGTAVVILLTCLFTLIAHWLACVWHAIGFSETQNKFGWIQKLQRQQYGDGTNFTSSNSSLSTRYITAIYFTLSSLTSVGFGNVSPNTDVEKVFSVCVMIFGALLYAFIFGNLTAIIQRLYSRTSRFHDNLRMIEDFVRFYNIPKFTREELEKYFRHEWAYTKGVDMETVIKRFPESLQADVCLHLHRGLFEECGVFKTASEGCLRALALRFKIRHYLPGHYIIKQGDEVKRLYFIAKGNIEVVKHDETVVTLGKGDVISCDYSTVKSLYIPQANASLRVQTQGEIHSVAWSDLVSVLKAYSSFREDFLTHLELAYNLGTEAEEEEIVQFVLSAEETSAGYPRRLSNARSTFFSHGKVDRVDRMRSATLFVNGQIPQIQERSTGVDINRQQHDGGSKTRIHNQMPSVNTASPSLISQLNSAQVQCSHNTEFRMLELRIENLESRLTTMDERLTENFVTILNYLRSLSKGCTAHELRTKNV